MKFKGVRGILFDIDGTLYHQSLMRLIMMALFVITNITRPLKFFKEAKIIRTYRKAQEMLRRSGQDQTYVDQFELAANLLNLDKKNVRDVIDKWIYKKPLPYVHFCRRKDLKEVIQNLYEKGFKLGTYSDYPGKEKLEALGILEYMSAVVCSTDPEVQRFKPSPIGFISAARKMEFHPSNILYVGDREDTDAVGASQAGMQVAIIKKYSLIRNSSVNYPTINSLEELLNDVDLKSSI